MLGWVYGGVGISSGVVSVGNTYLALSEWQVCAFCATGQSVPERTHRAIIYAGVQIWPGVSFIGQSPNLFDKSLSCFLQERRTIRVCPGKSYPILFANDSLFVTEWENSLRNFHNLRRP